MHNAGGLGAWHGVSDGAIHAALAALDEPPRELHRRIWSAQASVLLPIIDERRYEIVRRTHGQISTHLNMGRRPYRSF